MQKKPGVSNQETDGKMLLKSVSRSEAMLMDHQDRQVESDNSNDDKEGQMIGLDDALM